MDWARNASRVVVTSSRGALVGGVERERFRERRQGRQAARERQSGLELRMTSSLLDAAHVAKR
jgi:hypothetical protein